MEHSGRVTIGDVAREAGVSVATVSKVINARYGVAAATAARVRQVIDDLGYESSLVASSLRSRRTNVLGVLMPEFESFSTELLKGVSSAITGSGYELLAYTRGGRPGNAEGWERQDLSRLSGTLIDGAILVTPTVVDVRFSVPVVAVDPHTGPTGMPTVDSDNYAGALAAVEHLIAMGHRRIGFLGGRPELVSAEQRERGYREALTAAGVPVDPELMRVAGYRQQTADAPAHELLRLPDRPTAIFAANDTTAIHTMAVAHQMGLSVPDDISVVGFDNIPESALQTPPLTTIQQPLQEMGAAAVRMLIDLVHGKPDIETHVRQPTKLVERASVRRI